MDKYNKIFYIMMFICIITSMYISFNEYNVIEEQTKIIKELKYINNELKDENNTYEYKLLNTPTLKDVKTFLRKDKTDENLYIGNSKYDCTQFSNTLVRNALKENILMCAVEINYRSDCSHMIVAVNTSDKGLIYIEPQNDKIVELKIGINEWLDDDDYVKGWDSCFERVYDKNEEGERE